MTKSALIIRKAGLNDIPGILVLWKELMAFHSDIDPLFTESDQGEKNFAHHLRESIQSDDSAVFLAVDQGKTAGYLKADIALYPPVFVRKRYGMISDAAVTEGYRRTGTGEKLVEEALSWFRAKGVDRAELRYLEANPVSSGFWKKQGFTPYMVTAFREL